MNRRHLTTLLLPLLPMSLIFSPTLVAGEKDDEGARSAMTMALPETHVLTLTLIEGGESYAFSMTVASRHFSMNLGDKHIAFRGRLWQGLFDPGARVPREWPRLGPGFGGIP